MLVGNNASGILEISSKSACDDEEEEGKEEELVSLEGGGISIDEVCS